MQKVLRAILVAACFALVFIQGALAFNVSQLAVDPSGLVVPGTPIVITGTIDFYSIIG
jgi:hypothetical protein